MSTCPDVDRMDRELKVEQWKWPLYVLDEHEACSDGISESRAIRQV